jgi:hypothetical protein
MFAMRIDCPLDKRNKMGKKLRFINDHNLVRRNVDRIEILGMNARSIASIVSCNKSLTIPHVSLMSNHQNGHAERAVPRNDRKNVRTFTREHRTNDHIKGHLRRTAAV